MGDIFEKKAKKHSGGRPPLSDDCIRMGSVIRRYRLAAGLEQLVLAKQIGCSGNAISTWEAGRNGPSLNIIPKLCKAINMPLYDLLGMEAPMPALPKEQQRILDNFLSLNANNKATIDTIILRLLAEQDRCERVLLRRSYSRLIYPSLLSSAAGPGAPAPDYVDPEIVYIRASRASERSNLMLKVNGDSMEPDYPDGCRVFVDTDAATQLGDVGVFIVNGEYYIKERREDRLYSRNRKHDDILFTDGIDIRYFGHVLGIVNEDDIPTGEELDSVRDAYENYCDDE